MSRIICLLIFWSGLVGAGEPHYFFDSNGVRMELYQANGGKGYNWLFFPGGPGADSRYLRGLVDELELPGNVWLIDLPGNGDNAQRLSYDFDKWIAIFPEVIKQFDHAIIVGHSFGGMFPLLFPELEKELEGFVILNSAPCLWLEEAVVYSRQFDLPDLSREMSDFTLHPSQETFKAALDACMPYYFPKKTLEKGRAMLSKLPFPYQPAVWWQRKVIELNFSAKWVPQMIPTLIINSKYDCICPYSLFGKERRFQRPNIERLVVEDAGHFIWVDNPAATRSAFKRFISRLEGI